MSIVITCLFTISKCSAVAVYWNRTLFMETKDNIAMKTKKRYQAIGLLLLATVLWLPFSCTKENFTETTDTSPNINSFLATQERSEERRVGKDVRTPWRN